MRSSRSPLLCLSVAALALVWSSFASAAGGPLGIDHKLHYDDSGIWRRSVQKDLIYVMLGGEAVGALWEGGDTRLGKTFWQAIDSTALTAVSTQALKWTFTRKRPSESDSPDQWFQGSSYESFPSGEVATVSAIVTPFVLEYGPENPWVYGLEALPVYDAVARMKTHGHWQTDVLAGYAIGTLVGYYAHGRKEPYILNILPGGFSVGVRYKW